MSRLSGASRSERRFHSVLETERQRGDRLPVKWTIIAKFGPC